MRRRVPPVRAVASSPGAAPPGLFFPRGDRKEANMARRWVVIAVGLVLGLLALRAVAVVVREGIAVDAAGEQERRAGDRLGKIAARIAAAEARARMWEAVPLAGGALRDVAMLGDELKLLQLERDIWESIERTQRGIEDRKLDIARRQEALRAR